MKAAPPCSPVSTGKRQILPNPTEEPAVARMMPKRLAKFPRWKTEGFLCGEESEFMDEDEADGYGRQPAHDETIDGECTEGN